MKDKVAAIARILFTTLLTILGAVHSGITQTRPSAPQQAVAGKLEFEVASVKASPGNNGVRGGCHGTDSTYGATGQTSAPPLGRCVITDARIGHLINIAYELNSMLRIKGQPDWEFGNDRFNIDAKVDEPTKYTEAQLLEMLQNLLSDRFKLKFHWETMETAGFAMVVAKNGPKLRAAKSDEVTTSFGAQVKPFPGVPTELTARKYSMATLANLLSQVGPGPVIDKTKLPGDYDFTLSWDDTNGPALSTAIQEQLGLRLQAQKVPVSLFVIDSAERPSEN